MLEATAWTSKARLREPNIQKPRYLSLSSYPLLLHLCGLTYPFILCGWMQTKAVLFQPATEFLPMIDEVRVLLMVKYL